MKNLIQQGEDLTFVESALVHPSHSDGLVNGGDPVVVGRHIGVAYEDAAAATDMITIATRGVFDLDVTSVHNGISVGETVYIDPAAGTLSDDFNDVPFGTANEAISGNATDTINVKLFGHTPGATGANS